MISTEMKSRRNKKWLAIITTMLIAGLLTIWEIYGIEEYGIFLFFLIPAFIGAGPVILFGYKNEISSREARNIGFITLAIYSFSLLLFAIEGLVCIAMAAPLGIFLTWIGSVLGYMIIRKTKKNAPTTLLILIIVFPAFSFLEKDSEPELTSVVSSIEIKADPGLVWKNVIEFPQLKKPSEFIFKTGIAYPVNAKIEGTGVGAVRHCNFTTGSFVEPITIWEEPKLLRFDVIEQPAPLKELSFWDIDAPHLHDYFVSKQGQFKLTRLPNGNTLLEGTTWYYHNIRPAFYWKIWSDFIIHKIHNRVLEHIKVNSENQSAV